MLSRSEGRRDGGHELLPVCDVTALSAIYDPHRRVCVCGDTECLHNDFTVYRPAGDFTECSLTNYEVILFL